MKKRTKADSGPGRRLVQPRARHGRTEVAALRMNGANPAGTVPANPGVPADRGNARAATVAPASAPGKNSPQNEPSPETRTGHASRIWAPPQVCAATARQSSKAATSGKSGTWRRRRA